MMEVVYYSIREFALCSLKESLTVIYDDSPTDGAHLYTKSVGGIEQQQASQSTLLAHRFALAASLSYWHFLKHANTRRKYALEL
jgi:hypothetical protein